MLNGMDATDARSWLRCYRCWSQDLEVQVHYEGIHKIDPVTGERAEVVDELQEAVVQCLDCMHDQPHLGFAGGRVEPIEDRWERMIAGTAYDYRKPYAAKGGAGWGVRLLVDLAQGEPAAPDLH
jgi:hypothetical protein